ncbi:lipopolysaccharide biosynthesis protein [Coprococcus catus]
MNESRTSNSIKNISANIMYQVLSFVLSFVSRTVFIQVLGVGYLGINGLFNDVLSMLNLAELGFGTAMTYSMYKPLAEKDYDTLAGLTNFYKKVYRIIAFSIALIGILLVPFLPYLVNLEQDIPNLELYYLLFLASNVASYLVTYKTTVMYADQKNYIFVKYTAYWSVAQTATLTLVLFMTHNYIIYLCVQVLFVYASNFQKSFVAQKRYPFIGKKVKLPKEKRNGIFKDVGSAFLYKIANVLITATDNTLISVIVSTEMVGFYSNYQIVTSRLGTIVSTVFSSLITSLGNLLTNESDERRFHVFQIMQSVSLILSTFFVTCIFLLEEDFIRVWLGEDFVLGTLALVAIVFNFYFAISIMPITTFREAAGLFRKTKFVMLWTAFFNLMLSILLGRQIGLPGILFATSISKMLTSFWYEPILLFKEYFKKPCYLYFLQMLKGLGITLLSVAVSWSISHWIVPDSWLGLIFKGIVVGTVSLITTIMCYRRTPGFKLLTNKVKTIIAGIKKK